MRPSSMVGILPTHEAGCGQARKQALLPAIDSATALLVAVCFFVNTL